MDMAQKLRLESLLLGLGGGMLGGLLVYLVFSASGEKAAQMNLVGTIPARYTNGSCRMDDH